jgi:hypothetical protein
LIRERWKNTLEKCEENQKFVSFSAEEQVQRTRQIHELQESREAVKKFLTAATRYL